jgi:group I intron endonuclease
MKICGIYKIQSKTHPERCYIGSAVNIHNRWIQHKNDFKKREHSSVQFQRHYDKYGLSDFELSVIRECDKKELIPIKGVIWVEQYFIWAYQYQETRKPYFNASYWAGSSMGCHWSEEAKAKMSRDRKGKKKPPSHGANVSKALKGKPKNLPQEVVTANIERLAKVNKGSTRTLEQKANITNGLIKHWEEHPRQPIPLEERKKHGRPWTQERTDNYKEWCRKRKESGWMANPESQWRERDDKGHFIKTLK